MDPDRWSALAIRHLVAFDAVAREGSFRGAAERLGYTQSAVSQQIQGLERVVGQRLVERAAGRRAVGLTEAGELLLVHAQQILARTQEAHADLLALANGAAGTLRVGIYQSAGARVLPRVMARYAAAWPRVRVRLTESGSGYELLRLVEQGDLDLTFASLPIAEGGPFDSVELLPDEYVLLAPIDSPLVRDHVPTLEEICEYPLIAWRATQPGRGIEARLHERGLNPEVVFRSDDSGTVQGLVGAGVGVAIVTKLTVESDDPRVAIVKLSDQLATRSVGIAWHRDRYQSAAARAFVDVARTAVGAAGLRPVVDASA